MSLFKGFLLVLAMTITSLICTGQYASAKDLTGRLGVGFVNSYSNSEPFTIRDVPALSAKYAFTRDLAIAACVGLNTKDPTGFTLCTKVFKNVFYETNLNFYVAAALALVKSDKTGLEFQGVFGTEVFIPGLDSLGLSFEAGLAASNVTGSFELRTIGYTFLHAGVHFYF